MSHVANLRRRIALFIAPEIGDELAAWEHAQSLAMRIGSEVRHWNLAASAVAEHVIIASRNYAKRRNAIAKVKPIEHVRIMPGNRTLGTWANETDLFLEQIKLKVS